MITAMLASKPGDRPVIAGFLHLTLFVTSYHARWAHLEIIMAKFTVSVLTLGVVSAFAHAAAPPESTSPATEHIIVTANRMPQQASAPLASVDVLTQEEIKQLQPYSVVDLLSNVAGIDITRDGGVGQSASLFMRGTNSDHTLILINGMRVGSASLGYQSLATLPISQVTRVEIVRGPRAALYGADAIGGVIQIFTRGYDPSDGLDASVTAGSDQYYQGELGVGASGDHWHGGLTLGHQQTEGYNVQPNTQDDDDGNRVSSVSANGSYELTANTQLRATILAADGDYEYDFDPSYGASADKSDYKNYAWRTDLTHQQQWGSVDAWVGQNRDYERYSGAGTASYYYETRRQLAGVKAATMVTEHWALAGGWDWHEEQMSPKENYTDSKRHNNGFYAVSSGQWQALSSELALRYDDNSAFGSQTTYNAALGYQLTRDWRLSYAQGSGFKAPSFNDLFSPMGGNANLDAEKSLSREIALAGQAWATDWRISAYQTDIDHLIQWAVNSTGSYQAENVDKARIKGVEVAAEFTLAQVHQKLWASYIDARDETDDTRLVRRARKQFSWHANWQNQQWQWGGGFHFYGKRATATTEDLPSYVLWDATLRYQVSRHFGIHARLANLFDKDYQSNVGYETPGRAVYVGVDLTM